MKQKVKISLLRPEAVCPSYQSAFAAGADLYAAINEDIVIEPMQTVFVPTGIAMEIPEGYVGLICARSGLACKKGLAPANKVGVIDCDYRGEIMVALYNHGRAEVTVCKGDRVAQILLVPYLTAEFEKSESLSDTERAGGGFGSTGK